MLDRLLKIPTTVRNWNSVTKLLEIAEVVSKISWAEQLAFSSALLDRRVRFTFAWQFLFQQEIR